MEWMGWYCPCAPPLLLSFSREAALDEICHGKLVEGVEVCVFPQWQDKAAQLEAQRTGEG
jgi:hypothetical protein